jgi:D-alanyl-D-alanine carboxypeptidase (penicillin-binding protein 5/6)
MKKQKQGRKSIRFFPLMLFVLLVIGIGLYKTDYLNLDFFKNIYRRVEFRQHANDLEIPRDALAFSVYDIEQGEYLFYEGESQLPTAASLTKLFVIDYAMTKVDLDDTVEVNQEVLDSVPEGSSLAYLEVGDYTVKQIIEGMLVPSGNDAAYVLAYNLAKRDLGDGYTVEEYEDYFIEKLGEYLIQEGYTRTHLDDPSGFSMRADTHIEDINRVTLKLLQYDFIKECVSKAHFSIQTPQGQITWENTNAFLHKESPYYNRRVKGVKTGTMASSYNLVVLYRKGNKDYLITCLASHSNAERYRAVQSAINTIIN